MTVARAFGLREGRRAPIQVIEGNYQRLSGVCPWWDATVAGR